VADAVVEPVVVTDFDDPRLADYVGLRHGRQDTSAHFIVESAIAVSRLVGSRYPVRSFVLAPSRYDGLADVLAVTDAPIYLVEVGVLRQLVGFDLHRGVLAAATRLPDPLLTDVLATARRLVVLEGSNDHQNIGVIARSARGLGFDAMLLDPTCADPFYRRSVRVSMGEILHLPIVRCTQWPGALDTIAAAGFETWALTPRTDADVLSTLLVPDRLALLAGAEGPGLSTAALGSARRAVRIPLHHGVDSLNIGHAVAIAMAVTSPSP
jgi:tRNA G18 (ribose-2'-O)-methylase SpoU